MDYNLGIQTLIMAASKLVDPVDMTRSTMAMIVEDTRAMILAMAKVRDMGTQGAGHMATVGVGVMVMT